MVILVQAPELLIVLHQGVPNQCSQQILRDHPLAKVTTSSSLDLRNIVHPKHVPCRALIGRNPRIEIMAGITRREAFTIAAAAGIGATTILAATAEEALAQAARDGVPPTFTLLLVNDIYKM